MIQSRDDNNENRTTGGDEYSVTITLLGGGEEGEDLKVQGVRIDDLEDGRYVVTYIARFPGEYEVKVYFMGTFGGAVGPLRGSGMTIVFDEFASRDNNIMAGELVVSALKKDVLYLEEFTKEISDAIFVKFKDESWSGEQQIRVLMNVKENLLLIESRQVELKLLVDRSEAIVQYLRESDVVIPNLDQMLLNGKMMLEKILREAPQIHNKISPMMRAHSSKIRADLQGYESHVVAYKEELVNGAFKLFVTGPHRALDLLDAADELQKSEKVTCDKMHHVAKVSALHCTALHYTTLHCFELKLY